MYEITVRAHFDAAHHLREYQGKCARIHGHTWQVELALKGPELNEQGILVDFMEVKRILNALLEEWDHTLINDHWDFGAGGLNPTAENLARYLYERMEEELGQAYPQVQMVGVQIWESPRAGARYYK